MFFNKVMFTKTMHVEFLTETKKQFVFMKVQIPNDQQNMLHVAMNTIKIDWQ